MVSPVPPIPGTGEYTSPPLPRGPLKPGQRFLGICQASTMIQSSSPGKKRPHSSEPIDFQPRIYKTRTLWESIRFWPKVLVCKVISFIYLICFFWYKQDAQKDNITKADTLLKAFDTPDRIKKFKKVKEIAQLYNQDPAVKDWYDKIVTRLKKSDFDPWLSLEPHAHIKYEKEENALKDNAKTIIAVADCARAYQERKNRAAKQGVDVQVLYNILQTIRLDDPDDDIAFRKQSFNKYEGYTLSGCNSAAEFLEKYSKS